MGASTEAHQHRGGARRRSPRGGAWCGRSRASGASGTSLPFLAASLIGFVSLAALLYDQEFNLDERARGFVAAARRAAAARRPDRRRPHRHAAARHATRARSCASSPSSRWSWCRCCLVVFALAPNIGVAVVANAVITGAPRRCSLPGILAVALAGHPAPGPVDRVLGRRRCGSSPAWWSCRSSVPSATTSASAGGMLLMVPIFLIGGLVIATRRAA